jgi:7,8-dihydropterin-6-yl-methyl-4-(beta-D-ribofuranosyl)aminobenzene 5'-phosphate synthase
MSSLTAREPELNFSDSLETLVSVTIIYNNYPDDASLETDWGFACLVEYQGHQLLFDAGRNPTLFRKNVGLLEIIPEKIPTFFLSHGHSDHTAGIRWITEINPSVKCYLPATYAEDLKANGKLHSNSTGLSEPAHLFGPFYSTGDNFASFKEQGLVIKTEDGGVLITGCGHPGIIEMLSVATENLGIEVHTVIGGLHLLQTPDEEVKRIASELQNMGIKTICPTHCTGDRAMAIFNEVFGAGYLDGGTGKKLSLK